MATTAVTVHKQLSSADLTSLLQQTGWSEKSSGEAPLRMKIDGSMFVTPDGEMLVYNPNKPKTPAFTARIVKPLEEYWAIWISESNARQFGDPSLANTFAKRFVVADGDRKVWPSDLVYHELEKAGLYDDYGKPLKGSWKADILLQIVPESGQLTGQEPIFTLTLPTTSVIEFKGTSKAPDAGSVSEKHFIRKLCEFAIDSAGEGDPTQAVLDALTSLTLGGVVAEARILRAENKELNRTWSVVSFDPIHIEPMQDGDLLLQDGSDEDNT